MAEVPDVGALLSRDAAVTATTSDGSEPTRRSHRLNVMLHRREARVLREIAAAWGVPVGTAGYAILGERLAMAERLAPQYGHADGVAIAAAVLARILPRDVVREALGRATKGAGSPPPTDGA